MWVKDGRSWVSKMGEKYVANVCYKEEISAFEASVYRDGICIHFSEWASCATAKRAVLNAVDRAQKYRDELDFFNTFEY